MNKWAIVLETSRGEKVLKIAKKLDENVLL